MNELTISKHNIKERIFNFRNSQVMLDRDLAELYHVETKVLNQAVKRNIKRFPNAFRFQLSEQEKTELVTNCDRFSALKHSSSLPYVFTEQGVSMLSAILKSDIAIEISIMIIEAFVAMRKHIASNNLMYERFERIEKRLSLHDESFNTLFRALEDKTLTPSQGIFFDGQVFDAYAFVSDLIKNAKQEIILIDNYIDESVLTLFSKNQDIDVVIYTKSISTQLKLDLKKYNAQYRPMTVKVFKDAHDRFMIIDEKEVYHIGASLKDLGKKWFAFSKFDRDTLSILERLK